MRYMLSWSSPFDEQHQKISSCLRLPGAKLAMAPGILSQSLFVLFLALLSLPLDGPCSGLSCSLGNVAHCRCLASGQACGWGSVATLSLMVLSVLTGRCCCTPRKWKETIILVKRTSLCCELAQTLAVGP
jgi:hypothetical protein